MKPHEIVEFLNAYFSKMVERIVLQGGTIDKYMGDGILSMFGAPIADENHAKNAVIAAVKMREALTGINKSRESEGLDAIKMGVSIHTGPCLVGNIGSSQKMEYTAIGDTVNLTSRLEGLNKKLNTDILISEDTYLRVKDEVDVKALSEVQVRGREASIKIYSVLGLKNKVKSA